MIKNLNLIKLSVCQPDFQHGFLKLARSWLPQKQGGGHRHLGWRSNLVCSNPMKLEGRFALMNYSAAEWSYLYSVKANHLETPDMRNTCRGAFP